MPVERSRHMARRSKACFRVTDDGQVEGVAGRTYLQNECILLECLPDVLGDGALRTCSPVLKRWFFRVFKPEALLTGKQLRVVKAYAKSTWCPEKRILRRRLCNHPLPRSLCGLPVEVDGRIWGVIVVDSTNERLIEQAEISRFYAENAAVLSKLLECVK